MKNMPWRGPDLPRTQEIALTRLVGTCFGQFDFDMAKVRFTVLVRTV